MKKFLFSLLVACLIIPCAMLFVGCGGGNYNAGYDDGYDAGWYVGFDEGADSVPYPPEGLGRVANSTRLIIAWDPVSGVNNRYTLLISAIYDYDLEVEDWPYVFVTGTSYTFEYTLAQLWHNEVIAFVISVSTGNAETGNNFSGFSEFVILFI